MLGGILSQLDPRIVEFMANNGRRPTPEERKQLLQNDMNNSSHPNVQMRVLNQNMQNQIKQNNISNQNLQHGKG